MVIMALVTTFMTTPIVMALYAPARDKGSHTKTLQQVQSNDNELRMLECVYGANNVPSIVNLTEVFRGTRKHPVRVFLMHLLELSERSSAIAMVRCLQTHWLLTLLTLPSSWAACAVRGPCGTM